MLPYVITHSAVSADGRIDGFTPDTGLYYELISRWHEDATLAGSDTMLKAFETEPGTGIAEPEEPVTYAVKDETRPLLVVPDSRGRLQSLWSKFRGEPYWRGVIVLCAHTTPKVYLNFLKETGIDTITAGAERVDFLTALAELNVRYGIKTVRVDSGGTLNGILFQNRLVNEVSLLIHPCLAGGAGLASMFRSVNPGVSEPEIPLHLKHFEQLRDGIVWLVYWVPA